MAKILITLFFCTIALSGFSKCGFWKSTEKISEWSNGNIYLDSNWVFSEWVFDGNTNIVNAVWCPCGCPPPQHYKMTAINRNTGEKTTATKYISYTYIEPEKTEFEKVDAKFK